MTPIDYTSLLIDAFSEYADMIAERREIDLKMDHKEQFIRATINMLPESERGSYECLLDNLGMDGGLSAAVRSILQDAPKKFHTATQVKKALEDGGFDFSGYSSNPLSSVHAALKRLKDDEAEMAKLDGVMAWKWIGVMPVKIPAVEQLEEMYGLGRLNKSRYVSRFGGFIRPRGTTILQAQLEAERKEKK
jgi:hypothetical protein